MNIESYAIYALYTLIYVGFAVLMKYVLNLRVSEAYNADDQIRDGNMAVGLRRAGAQFGLAIAMMGVLSSGNADTFVQDILLTVLYGAIGTLFIISSLIVTDKMVLPGVDNTNEIKGRNHAVGWVEFGMLTATGIMAYSSIIGDIGGWVTTLGYFAAGQITLVLVALFYENVVLRNIKIAEAISAGNQSAGIYLAGKLISYALILKSAISGNGAETEFIPLITEYFMAAAAGLVMLWVFELVIDLLIVTTAKVGDILAENKLVPVVQLTVAKIGMALILSNAIL